MLERPRFFAATLLRVGANMLNALPGHTLPPSRATRWVWIKVADAITPNPHGVHTTRRPARPLANDAPATAAPVSAPATTAEAPAQVNISVDELRTQLSDTSGPILVDVREPQETVHGVIAGAKLIPMRAVLERIGELRDAGRPVVVYCASGQRSANVATQLRDRGVRALNLVGGVRAWESAGQPTERPREA